MSKGLGLLSGGLDSTLAAFLLKRQGIEVTGIAYVTPFFGAERAKKAAAQIGIPLIVSEIGEPHLEMIKNPRYGYGRNMNPCIDCHAMMFRRAGRIMEEEGFDFIFSGEVLAQRPMSQNLSALQAVSKHSGYAKKILRPLSARLLPITEMEESGLVDRDQLLDIQGRTRRRQEEYARAWGIVDYPSSGGGCLLTEPRFSERLRDLLQWHPEADTAAVEQLKLGRIFRIAPAARLYLGRNQLDNERICAAARPQDAVILARGVGGPFGLLVGSVDEETERFACAVVAAYGRGQHAESVQVELNRNGEKTMYHIQPVCREEAAELIV